MKLSPVECAKPLGILLSLLTTFFFPLPLMAVDCTSADITLRSQIEVDDFQTAYGGGAICDTVTGSLFIFAESITDLTPLSDLVRVVGDFSIVPQDILPNLDGLSSLTTVDGNFQIQNVFTPNGLDDLNSLSSLSTVGGFFGLQGTYVSDLDGLSALTSVGGDVNIRGNSFLSDCTGLTVLLDEVDDGLLGPGPGTAGIPDIGGDLDVGSNLYGCNSISEILANCSSAVITLDEQYKVDAFQAIYGRDGVCDTVTGLLEIRGADVSDLTPLSDLISVDSLRIQGTSVNDLDGLAALRIVGGESLFIHNNPVLTNLDGLSSLVTVGGNLVIFDNSTLVNIDGLSKLTSIGQIVADNDTDLQIAGNDNLTNINGLSSVTSVDHVYIARNSHLTDLGGLLSLTSLKALTIEHNPVLADLSGLSTLTSVTQQLNLRENDSLQNIDGLSNITIAPYMYIRGNSKLTNVDGLSNLSHTRLTILENEVLTNLDGLSSLSSADSIVIRNNESLTQVNGLSSLVSVNNYFRLYDNAALSECEGLIPLLNVIDDGEIGPGPGEDGIPDIGGIVFMEGNAPGCEFLDFLFDVGGSVSGLFPGTSVTLHINFGDELTAGTNGPFAFSNTQLIGAPYLVTVKIQPTNPDQTCTVANGSGISGNADITDVLVTCINDTDMSFSDGFENL